MPSMRKNRSSIAYVALLAFLLNAFLPFYATYAMPFASGKPLSAPFGEKILICTADGFKWVTWAELQKQSGHGPASHYKCPLCYLAAHGLRDAAPPVALTFAAVEREADLARPSRSFSLRHGRDRLPFTSRAPPFSSLI